MTNIIPAEPGYFVVIATVDFDEDETPLLVEDRTWPVIAWRHRKDQSRLEPVTVVDLPDPRGASYWCVVTPKNSVVNHTGRVVRNIADWRREILGQAAATELARNALGETVDQVIEATVMT